MGFVVEIQEVNNMVPIRRFPSSIDVDMALFLRFVFAVNVHCIYNRNKKLKMCSGRAKEK